MKILAGNTLKINLSLLLHPDTVQLFDCSKNFVNSLITKKTDIWKKCYLKRTENKNYIYSWVVIFLKNEKFLLNTDDDFINYIQTHESFYKVFS